ncbi:MAG: efflux family protein [Herbinix sp.]|jgi:putative MATE family efflux protein|nr:efflux family protein [Herbinix sp.]
MGTSIRESDERMNKTDNALGEKSIGKLLLGMAIPAIIAQLVNILYNIVDRIYIGHIPDIGATALTGVGVTFPIIMVISAFSALIGMGGAPRAAIKMGEKDDEAAENILGNCFTALLVISALLTIVFLFANKPLLMMFGASEETLPYALSYLNIYVCGTIFVQIALGLNSFITTQGFSKISMITVAVGATLNIILDPILIFGFDMGVEGAAIATVVSQGVSALWVLRFLTGKRTKLKIRRKYMKLQRATIAPVMILGLSPFIMQSTESLLSIAFNTSLQRYGGDIAVGAMTILMSLTQIQFMPIHGLCQGAQPIISYNYGAKNTDRVKATFRLLVISAFSYCTFIWLLMMLLPGQFISLFSSQKELISYTSWALRIFMPIAFLMSMQTCCQQTFLALGQAKVSILLALLRKMILLIPLIYIMPVFFEDKVFAIFFAEPVADFIAVTVTITTFAFRFKKILDDREPV